jgi:hypothetical protein
MAVLTICSPQKGHGFVGAGEAAAPAAGATLELCAATS